MSDCIPNWVNKEWKKIDRPEEEKNPLPEDWNRLYYSYRYYTKIQAEFTGRIAWCSGQLKVVYSKKGETYNIPPEISSIIRARSADYEFHTHPRIPIHPKRARYIRDLTFVYPDYPSIEDLVDVMTATRLTRFRAFLIFTPMSLIKITYDNPPLSYLEHAEKQLEMYDFLNREHSVESLICDAKTYGVNIEWVAGNVPKYNAKYTIYTSWRDGLVEFIEELRSQN